VQDKVLYSEKYERLCHSSIEGSSKGLKNMVCFRLLRNLFQTSSQVD
jgi:hypothetical protein